MPRRREGPTLNKQTGYYFFDEYIGFPPHNERVRFSLRTQDPEKAWWLWEREYKKQWGRHYGEESKGRAQSVTLRQLAAEFVAYERDVKKIKEWRIYKDRLAYVVEVWGDIDISKINHSHFVALDKWLRSNRRSKNTVNHYVSMLKTMFNYAIKQDLCAGKNPALDITPHLVDEKRREYSSDELKRILAAGDRIEREARPDATVQKYAKRILLLLLYTGMRAGEVLNLKWDNIQGDVMRLRRTETKQRKDKVIPITAGIRAVLDSLHDKRRTDGHVFPLRRRDGIFKSSWTDSVIRKVRKYSGVEDFIFHNIRHTASTIMVSNAIGQGVGFADVMQVLGHSQVDTTMKYVHSNIDRMRKAVEVLEKETKGD